MSTYEDYTRTAQAYAKWRKPLGVGIVVGYFTDLIGSGSRILDVGCGPGLYAKHLASSGFAVTGIDLSNRQLELAQNAVTSSDNKRLLFFRQGDACSLPFKNSEFDGALMNMMLHHLDNNPERSRSTRAISEAARVLRDNGILIIGTVSQEQAKNGAWYYNVFPPLSQRFADRLLPEDDLIRRCSDAGLTLFDKVVPLVQVFRPDSYFCADSILDEDRRSSTSLFSLLSDEELVELVSLVKKLIINGDAEKIIAEHENTRRKYGQISYYIFVKK